jgi:2,3-bisphosphoglycerate-dependent phosphoglycerate mutase
MTSTLVLLRHGQSDWNARNLFTGWWDADLSETGEQEATGAGRTMADAGLDTELDVIHTSLQTRAIRTAELALHEMGLSWLPVRYGEDQVFVWRRSYDVPPPPIAADNPYDPNGDRRYARLPPEIVPASECLQDVVARVLPYWFDAIVADLAAGASVLVAAHGNSLRALVKHLDGIGDDEIAGLNLPTGVPIVYDLGDDYLPVEDLPPLERALGDADAIAAAAEAVANQASAAPTGGAPGDDPEPGQND